MKKYIKILFLILIVFSVWFLYKIETTIDTELMFETDVYQVNVIATKSNIFYVINGSEQYEFRVDVTYDTHTTKPKLKVYQDYFLNPFTGSKVYCNNNGLGIVLGYSYKLILPTNFKIN